MQSRMRFSDAFLGLVGPGTFFFFSARERCNSASYNTVSFPPLTRPLIGLLWKWKEAFLDMQVHLPRD